MYKVSVPKKILYVEDDSNSRNLVTKILSIEYDVDTAVNAEVALKKIKENFYHLFLLDINLGPGMNGIDVMKFIRKYFRYKNTPVIALTAYPSYGTKEYFLSEGFSHYISKPFVKAELIKIINNAFNSID